MRYLSFFFLLLSFSLCTGKLLAQSGGSNPADSIGGTLTLRQAVDIAIRNNLVVVQSDLSSQNYKVGLDQSWEYMLPTLNASGSQGIRFGRSINSYTNQPITAPNDYGSLGISSGLTLFKGLQYHNNLTQARYAYAASNMDLH